LSKEIINERIADRGLELLGKYTNTLSKTLFQCSKGHTWEATPGNVMGGTGCPRCSGREPLTKEIVNQRIAIGWVGWALIDLAQTLGTEEMGEAQGWGKLA